MVSSPDGWEFSGEYRFPETIYVIGKFVPPDIHFIQNVNNIDLRLLMLKDWELRNNARVV